MSRIVVYVVNEHPFYMKMAAHSIKMLRQHSKVPAAVFHIEDGERTTLRRKGQRPVSFGVDEFRNLCRSLNVDVRVRPPVDEYFHYNRSYLSECVEDCVFHMDGDTFIFRDVSELLDKYAGFDFVAAPSNWMSSTGFNPSIFLPSNPVDPFNSGVMIWNNGTIREWAANLKTICEGLAEGHSATPWLKASGDLHKEELSVTAHVSAARLSHAYFGREECFVVEHPIDLKEYGTPYILHTYTDQWAQVYDGIIGRRPPKMPRRVVRPALQKASPTV